jgi:phage gpG-like protein
MRINIEIAPKSKTFIHGFDKIFEKGIKKGFRKVVREVERFSKKFGFNRPGKLKVRTGNLRRSIYSKVDGHLRGYVATEVKYGAIHQYGGVIIAKDKKYLRFKIGDQWVTTGTVKMPARPFILQPPFYRISNIIEDSIEEEFDAIK